MLRKKEWYPWHSLCILMLLACCTPGFAQSVRGADNVSQYFHYTNKAARSIYDNQFDMASAWYDSAFAHKVHPFYADLKNYILVNHKSGRYAKNEKAIVELISFHKISPERLFEDIPWRVFSVENIALMEKLGATLAKKMPGDNEWQRTLREIYARDQSSLDYDSIDMSNIAAAKEAYARRDSVVAANFLRFKKLYERFGFPSHEKVGIFYDDEHEWTFILSGLMQSFISRKGIDRNQELASMINSALRVGDLHPSIGAWLLDRIHTYEKSSPLEQLYMANTICEVSGEIYKPFVFYSDSLMRVVNANRLSIGLDSFHITQKQMVCQFAGAKSLEDRQMISMVPYASIDALPAGFVRQAAKDAGVDMLDYKINTGKILEGCFCEWKGY